VRRKDGSLTGAGESTRSLGSGSSEGGAAGGAGALDGDDVYRAAEENEYGFGEPRLLGFVNVTTEPLMRLEDASATASAPPADLHVRRIRHVQRHAVNRTVVRLGFHDGDVLRTVSKRYVFTFRSNEDRERFIAELVELAGPDARIEADAAWNPTLPTRAFHRFEATRVRVRACQRMGVSRLLTAALQPLLLRAARHCGARARPHPHTETHPSASPEPALPEPASLCLQLKPRRMQCALMVDARRKKILVIRVKDISSYEPGVIIPSNVRVGEHCMLRVPQIRIWFCVVCTLLACSYCFWCPRCTMRVAHCFLSLAVVSVH
jgi:hypothetical protein